MKKPQLHNLIILGLGTVAITLSGLNWHIGIAAWIGPALLLYFTRNSKWRSFFIFLLFMIISGGISQTGNNIFNIFLFNIINGLTFGIYYSLAYVVDKLLYKKKPSFFYSLIFPATIVIQEYIASFIFGSWGIVAHTQYPNLPLMQIASVTGLYGISFIVTWFGSVVNWMYENRSSKYHIRKATVIYGSILILVLLFGSIRLTNNAEHLDTVKVATIVGSVDLHKVAEQEKDSLPYLIEHPETKLPQRIFSTQSEIDENLALTSEAIAKGAKIIVWNEVALLINSEQKAYILDAIKVLCTQHPVYVLIAVFEENISSKPKPFNNLSIMVAPGGEIVWEYSKANLHPYVEVPIVNPGVEKIPYTDSEYGRIGNVICADMDHSNYIANTGKDNMDILLVPGFDWKGITPLHSEMICVEAIQNGVSIIRANGKGVSIVMDPYGREVASMNTFESNEKMLVADLPLYSVSTIFTKIGNVFSYFCIIFLLFVVGIRIFKRK